jgi:KaiC/GvpD/RAD55 family RecA-like ATPase
MVEGQPLTDATSNIAERDVLSAVVSHIQRSWQAALGVSPSEHELRALLLLLRIHVLDVDAGGADEQEAKDRLRTTILCDPGRTDVVWARMIEFCARLAAERSGVDRSGLQQVLLSAGIDLQAPRSYREDIECLRAHTRSTARLLSQLARIRIGTTEIKIDRPSTDTLRHAAEKASLLVIGEPGAGKSGALHDLTDKLIEEGRDVVFLAVDHFAARSLGELRGELGLERGLTDVLANWAGTTPAFLVIDALDAARTDPAARAFRNLIQSAVEQQGRWRVVASIREFDLRYSHDLQQLFSGEPLPVFRDQSLSRVRHLQVPRLSLEEMAQIPSQSPALQALLDRAPTVLRELLRVPFNLRLMAELLGEGIDPIDLTPIQTQLELLDRYWRHRIVRDDGQRDAREGLLRHACEEMVRARMLRVDRSSVATPGTSLVLDDLLSTHILSEWRASPAGTPDQYVLTFAHHVLFDYAVARLLFRGTPEKLLIRLTDDPELVIVVRPSLLLHFQHLCKARQNFLYTSAE